MHVYAHTLARPVVCHGTVDGHPPPMGHGIPGPGAPEARPPPSHASQPIPLTSSMCGLRTLGVGSNKSPFLNPRR